MTQGIYIMANDQVMDDTIACLNSIREHDPAIPIVLIPYDDNPMALVDRLQQHYGVVLYPDLALIERLSAHLQTIFGKEFFARPNQFRKQACWFGPFERFLYIDTDTVVFSPIAKVLDYLDHYDFLCYDYQHQGGIRNVFTHRVIEQGIFREAELKDVFNCGFWASKRGVMGEQDLYQLLQECAAHPEYFDFSEKTSDQPIMNYIILKRVTHRFNLVRQSGRGPGNWAGSPHFVQDGWRLVDPNVNKPLDYLHWAGFPIQPGCPYWEIWNYYRHLHEPEDGSQPKSAPNTKAPFFRSMRRHLKTVWSRDRP